MKFLASTLPVFFVLLLNQWFNSVVWEVYYGSSVWWSLFSNFVIVDENAVFWTASGNGTSIGNGQATFYEAFVGSVHVRNGLDNIMENRHSTLSLIWFLRRFSGTSQILAIVDLWQVCWALWIWQSTIVFFIWSFDFSKTYLFLIFTGASVYLGGVLFSKIPCFDGFSFVARSTVFENLCCKKKKKMRVGRGVVRLAGVVMVKVEMAVK